MQHLLHAQEAVMAPEETGGEQAGRYAYQDHRLQALPWWREEGEHGGERATAKRALAMFVWSCVHFTFEPERAQTW